LTNAKPISNKKIEEEFMTTVDFKAEVEKRRDEMMADLYSLLEINSERDDSKADAEHPFGPGPVKAIWDLCPYGRRACR